MKKKIYSEVVYIYLILDPRDNFKGYIGKTVDFKKRKRQHLLVNENNKKCAWIKKLKSLGMTPEFVVLDCIAKEDWEFWEKYWISQFKTWGFNLMNHTEGGMPGGYFKGGKHRENSKKKISENSAKFWLGKEFSEEHKRKLSLSHKGKKLSLEHIEKIKGHTPWNKGKEGCFSEESIKKMSDAHSGENHHNFGKKLSDETKKKLSQSKIGDKNPMFGKKKNENFKNTVRDKLSGSKSPNSKTVIQYSLEGEFLKEWGSINEISRELGFTSWYIGLCCNDKKEKYKNFIWKFKK
jgi:group I intron endonuclease